MNLKITYKSTAELVPYARNSRTHSDEQVAQIMASVKEYGFTNPVLTDGENGIIAGHGRVIAAQRMKLDEVPTIELSHLTEAQKRAYIIADNKLALNSGWDEEMLKIELEELQDIGYDLDLTGFSMDELIDMNINLDGKLELVIDESKADDVPLATDDPVIKLGDLIEFGNHRLLCEDSTNEENVKKLMNGEIADMVFTDPPYGMKKEKDGVLNDNLNYDDLLEFNKKWIPLSFGATKENGSWYCWGIDEPLMDIYCNILKPMIKTQKATFRNLITWDKGFGQGQNSENTRSYAIADEKCLFVMCGVQGFNNNADNYFDGWEPIRDYLLSQRTKANWDIPTMKKIAGHSDLFRDHWTSKSQFSMPTEKVYKSFQNYCIENNIDAFKKEYDELKKEYDELKKEYYSTRAYFNNTHDNFNNVWHFNRHIKDGTEGGHATPKPIELCERAIMSSSRESETVLDLFLGSGSTLIACENLNRKCYGLELDPKYAQVIIQRWSDYTSIDTIKINGKEVSWSEYKDANSKG